ncbi:tyrosine-protein phosphatase [Nocardia asteroides]
MRDTSQDDPLDGVQRSWPDAAFEEVDRTCGGFDAYVRDGLRLTDGDLTAPRARLLG